jgi:hypothetical protein
LRRLGGQDFEGRVEVARRDLEDLQDLLLLEPGLLVPLGECLATVRRDPPKWALLRLVYPRKLDATALGIAFSIPLSLLLCLARGSSAHVKRD